MDPRLKKLSRFAKKVNEKHGKGTLTFGPRVIDIPRLRTGSLLLDVATGGGFPVGRCTMLWGKESSGKTYLAYKTVAENQNRCANCLRFVEIEEVIEHADEETGECLYEAKAYCDCYAKGLFEPRPFPEELNPLSKDKKGNEIPAERTLKMVEREVLKADGKGMKKVKVSLYEERLERYKENSYEEYRVAIIDVESSWDPKWAAKMGVDTRRVILEHPDTAEQAIDLYDSLFRTGAVDLLILDSLAQMTPSDEIEASAEDWQQGLQARLLNKLVRKVGSAVAAVRKDYGRQVTQIWINQVRVKLHSYGNPEVKPGGFGQNFVISTGIKLWNSDWETEEVEEGLNKDDQRKIGKRVRINFVVDKNKTAPAKSTGSFVLNLETAEIEELDQIVSLCERYGEIKKDKTKWLLGGNEFKTKGALIEHLMEPDEWKRVRGFLMKKMLGAVS